MNILITAGASVLAHDLAQALSPEHTVRLTDTESVQTRWSFVHCDLGHDPSTDHLVDGVDALIHLAAAASDPTEGTAGNAEQGAIRLIDYHTRCTYNLLHAASEAGVARCIYASSLSLFAGCEENWAIDELWRPRPSTEPTVLALHAGEFVCREFARENRIPITCLRLGQLEQAESGSMQPKDPTWLSRADAVQAFACALAAAPKPWAIYHIQSAFPGARFSIAKARDGLGYATNGAVQT